MSGDRLESTATLHARLRWAGIGLFGLALIAFALNLAAAAAGHAPFARVLLSVFALGMSLGTFGANCDTALHAMRQLHREGRLPARFAAEWAHERAVRPEKIEALHAAPRMALALPVVAFLAVTWASWRGLVAWGLA